MSDRREFFRQAPLASPRVHVAGYRLLAAVAEGSREEQQ